MKKGFFIGVLLLLLLSISAQDGLAMGPFNFYVRSGVITDDGLSFDPFLWLAGANLDLNLGPILTLSPECDMVIYKFNFNPVWLTPSVLLNLRFSSFYFGAGVSKFFLIGSGFTLESAFLLKLNAGFKTDFVKLQAFIYTPFDEIFEHMGVGATLGFGF